MLLKFILYNRYEAEIRIINPSRQNVINVYDLMIEQRISAKIGEFLMAWCA